MKKIVICGGHLTPTLALIDKLKDKDCQLIFFGRKYSTEGSSNFSAEYNQISKLKLKFYEISAGRLQRKLTRYTIISLIKLPIGFVQSFFYLLATRPNFVVSFGGYLSFPIVFSAWLLGIKSVTHEQSIVAGLANKLNSIFTSKIFLTWSETQKSFPKEKTQVIGNLTRDSIFKKQAKDKNIAKFLKDSGKLILFIGGNQGSHFLNTQVFKTLPALKNFYVFHQVGTANFKGDLDKAKKITNKNYFAIDYIDADNIGAVISSADLVVSRSGANTVWDLASLKKVAILVPLPHSAGGEQLANANILKVAGSAQILNQDSFDDELLISKINDIFKNYQSHQSSANSFQSSIPKDSASKLASYILSYTKISD